MKLTSVTEKNTIGNILIIIVKVISATNKTALVFKQGRCVNEGRHLLLMPFMGVKLNTQATSGEKRLIFFPQEYYTR